MIIIHNTIIGLTDFVLECELDFKNLLEHLSGHCLITFSMRHSRGEMYIGHGRLCVCLSLAALPHYCMDPDVTWGNGRECPLVVHYWVDLQSVHGFRCCDIIAPNARCQRVLVLTLCLVSDVLDFLPGAA